MNSGSIGYLNLKELANEEYSVADGEADITGWPVRDENSVFIGKIRDLLFDPEQNAVRYLIVDLDKAVSAVEDKAILLPIGFVNLAEDKKEVVIPVLHDNQIELMPQYIIGEVTRDTEMQIRSAIGSPAALRMEEETVDLIHLDFYQHHHFDRGNILSREKEFNSTADALEPVAPDREDEKNAIREIIENSDQENAAGTGMGQPVDGRSGRFAVNLEAGSFVVEPQENGTYRILRGEDKIGVVYTEAAHEGTMWRTMDKLDDDFVLEIGKAIASHHMS